MSYEDAVQQLMLKESVEQPTMIKTPCLQYRGEFLGMFFDKADTLTIKVSQARVDVLID